MNVSPMEFNLCITLWITWCQAMIHIITTSPTEVGDVSGSIEEPTITKDDPSRV